VIKSGNNYTLISKRYKKYDVKTHQSITLILDAKATKFHEKLRLDMQQNCEHPTVVDTDKVRLFAFSKNKDADYCRVKTRDILEAWTINFETGELKKINHKGMSCNISYYLSGLGPKCKKIEGLKNAK
jgi:hypothetical protein